jgi:3-phytase
VQSSYTPVFDGPEKRNAKRNYDEIRFWVDYINNEDYIYDDDGITGGLPANSSFVIAGDMNADPNDGDSLPGAINQLLDDPLVNTEITPSSNGGTYQATNQGGVNLYHISDPAYDTADFGFIGEGEPDGPPGNLRVDYVLVSAGLDPVGGGVFWPAPDEDYYPLAEYPTSDHRLVYMDIEFLDDGNDNDQMATPTAAPSVAGPNDNNNEASSTATIGRFQHAHGGGTMEMMTLTVLLWCLW